jgi:hypothetical protein
MGAIQQGLSAFAALACSAGYLAQFFVERIVWRGDVLHAWRQSGWFADI